MRLCYLMLSLMLPLFLMAQKTESGSIKGKVTTTDGEPVSYMSVQVKDSRIGTITDEDGSFQLNKLKPGKYVLVFSLAGNIEKSIVVEIREHVQTVLPVQIHLSFVELQKVIVQSALSSAYVQTNPSTSLRLKFPLNEIPQNIHVTTGQLLADQGLISMSEATGTVSGVQISSDGLNDVALSIRGFAAAWSVLRNGLGGYLWNQQADVAMLEKIEFIKGPAGFIVSDLPPSGFVNVVTNQPVKELVANVNLTVGSFNLYRANVDLGGSLVKKSALSYRFNTGIQRQKRAFEYGKASRFFIGGALRYEPGKKTSITVEYNYMWGKTAGNNNNIPSINGKMFALPRNFAVADDRTDKLIVADNYFRLEAKHQFSENWDITLLLGRMHGKQGPGYMLNAAGNIPVTNNVLMRRAIFDEWQNFSNIAQVYTNGSFHTGHAIEHKVLVALDYNRNGVYDRWGRGKLYGLNISNTDYYIHPDTLQNFSANNNDTFRVEKISFFAEDHIKINNKLIITFAGRFTHSEIKNTTSDTSNTPVYQQYSSYNRLTPRLGLTWLISQNISAYMLYDRYFLPVFIKNFDRKPSEPVTGYNAEAGLKSYFLRKKLDLGFSFYHFVTNNTRLPDPMHPGYFIQAGQVTNNGFEFDATGIITPALMINANYAFADARVTKGDAATQGRKNIGTPDHSCNVWMTYKLLSGKMKGFSLGLGYHFMGKRGALGYGVPGTGNYYLPVYHLLDATVAYRNDRFNVRLNLYNITNENYAITGFYNYPGKEWRYNPGEPINFRLSVGINLARAKNSPN